MELTPTLELVYFTAIAALMVILLLWFILAFIPSVLGLRDKDQNKF
jgi:hypothetical protein